MVAGGHWGGKALNCNVLNSRPGVGGLLFEVSFGWVMGFLSDIAVAIAGISRILPCRERGRAGGDAPQHGADFQAVFDTPGLSPYNAFEIRVGLIIIQVKPHTLKLMAGFLAIGLAGSARAQTTTFDTSTDTGLFPGWGPGAYYTFGQTFVAPGSGPTISLNNFTFYLQGGGQNTTIYFQADVFAWTGQLTGGGTTGQATGAALFSDNTSTYDDGTLKAVPINTGGLTLTPGQDYVALFTASDPTSIAKNGASDDTFNWGSSYDGDVPGPHGANNGGGGFVFYNNDTLSQLTDGSTWDTAGGQPDFGYLAWQASFSPVPEPTTLALGGLGGLALWLRRRKA